MSFFVLIRGGGDLGSGVALRLYRAGLRVAIAEIPQPLCVRRKVCFAEAVYAGETTVEEVIARRVNDFSDTFRILRIFSQRQVPVLIDPDAGSIQSLRPTVLVDARMIKQPPYLPRDTANLYIGLGPGFEAGVTCHAVIETNRGPFLGRVYWQGTTEPDTGLPEPVQGIQGQRVLRAPASGLVETHAEIGDQVQEGSRIASVGGQTVTAPFTGNLRGLIHPGIQVEQGAKIGDLDPRGDPRLASLVSDKSLSVGGGVLEAILSRTNLRPLLWT